MIVGEATEVAVMAEEVREEVAGAGAVMVEGERVVVRVVGQTVVANSPVAR